MGLNWVPLATKRGRRIIRRKDPLLYRNLYQLLSHEILPVRELCIKLVLEWLVELCAHHIETPYAMSSDLPDGSAFWMFATAGISVGLFYNIGT